MGFEECNFSHSDLQMAETLGVKDQKEIPGLVEVGVSQRRDGCR